MSWRALPDARVDCADIVSHAVLPDGQTIFVSVGITPDDEATYSFHGGGEREFRVEAPRRVGAAVPRTRYFDGDLRLRLRAGVQRLRLRAPPGVEAEQAEAVQRGVGDNALRKPSPRPVRRLRPTRSFGHTGEFSQCWFDGNTNAT
jgi:hypothetical protein